MARQYQAPGVYLQDVFVRPSSQLRTGVPAFLGDAGVDPAASPCALTDWSAFATLLPGAPAESYLRPAVRGFFANGGELCYVVQLDPGQSRETALASALAKLDKLDGMDLVCAPDLLIGDAAAPLPSADDISRLQSTILEYCDKRKDCMAILDLLPGIDSATATRHAEALRNRSGSRSGAVYYPWLRERDTLLSAYRAVPPSGHIAGIYARTDRGEGVHKAPANAVIEGAIDLERRLDLDARGALNEVGVNCLVAFPGRGIRVWGARTLSAEAEWRYVNVRRCVLTLTRWIRMVLTNLTFEPNTPELWARITSEVSAYLEEQFRRGALKGSRPAEGFYVKCDAETNAPDVRERGVVVTEIGVAPSLPNEFIVIRLINGPNGLSLSGPQSG